MKHLSGLSAFVTGLLLAGPALAQAPTPARAPIQNGADATRPATTTVSGTTGLWYVPTAEVLPARRWSASFYRTNTDENQGFSDISTFPATFAVGIGNRAEIFGSWSVNTRIDRDARPWFFSPQTGPATGGGILLNYPLDRTSWTGNKIGDAWAGTKINLLSSSNRPMAVATRAMVKIPVGDDKAGVSSGKADVLVDAIVSGYNPMVELSAHAGVMVRGNPAGYKLSNGLKWGVGAALPQRYSFGLRLTTELFGEHLFNNTISAPAGQFGSDGSPVPTLTSLRGPVTAAVGLSWLAPNGLFLGAQASWNVSMQDRAESGSPNTPKDDKGFEVRLGYHPGARNRSVSSTANRAGSGTGPGGGSRVGAGPGGPGVGGQGPGAGPSGAGTGSSVGSGAPAAGAGANTGPGGAGAGGAAANRPPTVRASCAPCSVEVGRTSTISADAQDPDGDPLTYQWTTASGAVANPTSRQSVWTAPTQAGAVPVSVSVSDGRGGTAQDSVTIQVTRPVQRQYTFEDVHYEFDRSTLRPDALRLLDDAVTAMNGDPTLRLEIEGHTCNIGTAEYNLALGERRARAVRDYLVSRGISAERLRTVSYGEERPKYDNSREETRRLNRRAALTVRLQ